MHPTFGEEDKIHGEPMAQPTTTEAKIGNFFYHYKWHTIIGLFLVFVFVICSLQFCSRESYDVHVMYAGPKGLVSAQTHAAAVSLEGIARDYNGDGEVKVSFNTLYIDKRIGFDGEGGVDASILAQRSSYCFSRAFSLSTRITRPSFRKCRPAIILSFFCRPSCFTSWIPKRVSLCPLPTSAS